MTMFNFDPENFLVQIFICLQICLISLQADIFRSPGYLKYVTQTDGSMDLLVSLSDLKKKSITYVFNNEKGRGGRLGGVQQGTMVGSRVSGPRVRLSSLHDAVKATMAHTDMIRKSIDLLGEARSAGCTPWAKCPANSFSSFI